MNKLLSLDHLGLVRLQSIMPTKSTAKEFQTVLIQPNPTVLQQIE